MKAIPYKVETSEKGTRYNRYYFHCVDCGAEFVTGRYGKNTKPYCIDCEKKYEREKAKERIRRKEAAIRNKAIDEFVEALEKHQQENWVDNLEYGITWDDIQQVAEQLKAKE